MSHTYRDRSLYGLMCIWCACVSALPGVYIGMPECMDGHVVCEREGVYRYLYSLILHIRRFGSNEQLLLCLRDSLCVCVSRSVALVARSCFSSAASSWAKLLSKMFGGQLFGSGSPCKKLSVMPSAVLWWLTPGCEEAVVHVFGGEAESRGRVQFVPVSKAESDHEKHGFFLAYRDNAGVSKIHIGFHYRGDEEQLRTHELSEVSGGVYRDTCLQIAVIVVEAKEAMEMSVMDAASRIESPSVRAARARAEAMGSAPTKHVFQWIHPGRNMSHILIGEDLRVTFMSSDDDSFVGLPNGHGHYYWCEGGDEYWCVHYHFRGGDKDANAVPTLLKKLQHGLVPASSPCVFRAVGSAATVSSLGQCARCCDVLTQVSSSSLRPWHILMLETAI